METIFRAAREGYEGAVSRLLDAGPVLLEATSWRMDRPLKTAAEHGQLGVVKLLVQRGANVNATGSLGRTALHEAADRGHEEVVAFLLEHGAEANSRDRDQRTPLLLACMEGHLGLVQMLLYHVGPQGLEDRDENGWTGLHRAATSCHEEVVAFLLSQGAQGSNATNDGRTPLICAAESGRLEVVQVLLQHVGTQGLEDRDEDGRTALYVAAEDCDEKMVAFLLSQGAQGDIATDYGRTALMVASGSGGLGVVRILLQHVGAEGLNKRDENGWTALHYVVDGIPEQGVNTYFNGVKGELVRFLLLAGADPTTMDNEGRTPLTFAQEGPSEEDVHGLREEKLREIKEEYAKCVALFEWWEGELD